MWYISTKSVTILEVKQEEGAAMNRRERRRTIEEFGKDMRRRNYKDYSLGTFEVFGKHYKECDHSETIVIENFTSFTSNLCMGCGSDVTVTGQGIEIGHGKFYPSQYTKLLYRKLLTLKAVSYTHLRAHET